DPPLRSAEGCGFGRLPQAHSSLDGAWLEEGRHDRKDALNRAREGPYVEVLRDALEGGIVESKDIVAPPGATLGVVPWVDGIHAFQGANPGRALDDEGSVGLKTARGQRMAGARLVIGGPNRA